MLWICCTSCKRVDCVPPAGGETLAASGALEGLSLRDGPADSMPPLPLLLLSKLLAIFRLSIRPAMASGETSSPLPASEEELAPESCCRHLGPALASTEFSYFPSIFLEHKMCWFGFWSRIEAEYPLKWSGERLRGFCCSICRSDSFFPRRIRY